MTREHAQALLPIITAYAEGKTIQHDDNAGSGHPSDWRDMPDPQFRGDPRNLRIKPEPDPYAELKAAHAAGKVIQHFGSASQSWWDLEKDPSWNWPPDRYRIKPEPKLVPMTSDDLPPVVWVRSEPDAKAHLVTSMTKHRMYFPYFNLHLDQSMENWEWSPDRKTWHSFMKEVEG